jgi:C4-dicarboxylate-specific signal transduction histidine kinase
MKNDAIKPVGESSRRGMSGDPKTVSAAADLEQMTASISEEIKQPITATLIYAQAAARWLSANPPNEVEAQRALDGIVYNVMRSNEIVEWIRALFVYGPKQVEEQQLVEAIRNALALLRTAMKEGDGGR